MVQPGIIFDMDGVVVDNDRYHMEAWVKIAQQYGLSLTRERYQQEMNGRTMAACIDMLFGDRAQAPEIARFGEEKEALYREIYRPHIRAAHGLPGLLETLQQANIPCALATSAPTVNVDFVMEHTGLRPFFQSIIDDSGVKNGKPDPEIFLSSAANLGREAQHCLVFEDSLMGIRAARNANMKVVGLATTLPASQLTHADAVIADFREISLSQLRSLIDGAT